MIQSEEMEFVLTTETTPLKIIQCTDPKAYTACTLKTEHTSVTEPKAKQNCAISLGREGPGICFTIFGLLGVAVYVDLEFLCAMRIANACVPRKDL